MIKKQKIILVLMSTSVFLAFLILTAFSKTTLDYQGFSIDAAGQVYIGKSNRIDVYCGSNEVVHSFFHNAISRGYAFAVQQEHLYVATGSYVYKFSLTGELLERRPDDADIYYQFLGDKWKPTSVESDTYRFSFWGKLSIIKNETTIIWEESTFSAIVRCGFIISSIAWFLSVIYFVASNQHDWWKKRAI